MIVMGIFLFFDWMTMLTGYMSAFLEDLRDSNILFERKIVCLWFAPY